MKELAKYADYLFILSFLGIVLAAYGAFIGSDLWLGSTQWLLVSVALVVYALYVKTGRSVK